MERYKIMRANTFIPFLLFLSSCVAPAAVTVPSTTTPIASAAERSFTRTVANGQMQRIGFHAYLHPDCTSMGYPTIGITTPPAHGELTAQAGNEYPFYPKENQRYQCNLRSAPGMNIYYRSTPGYVGSDLAVIAIDAPPGASFGLPPKTFNYVIAVK